MHRLHILCIGLVSAVVLTLALQIQLVWLSAVIFLFWGYLFLGVTICLIGLAGYGKYKSNPALVQISLVLFLIFSISFAWPFATDFIQNLTPKASISQPIKVISFNWLGSNPDKLSVYRWIAQEKPDILAIQEFSQNSEGVETLLYPQFPYRTKGDSDILILSRFPLSNEKTERIHNHYLVKVTATIHGQSVAIYGIHPSTLRTIEQTSWRNAYLSTLTTRVESSPGPIISLGDFNATRWDPWFRRFANIARLHEEPRLFPIPTRMGVRSNMPDIGSPIDHILVSRNQHISSCRTGPPLGSDHLPLICNVSFNTQNH